MRARSSGVAVSAVRAELRQWVAAEVERGGTGTGSAGATAAEAVVALETALAGLPLRSLVTPARPPPRPCCALHLQQRGLEMVKGFN